MRNAKARDLVQKGDHAGVIGIDWETNRISLSIKQTLDDPWFTVSERWQKGVRTEGTVTNLTDFGAFRGDRARGRGAGPHRRPGAGAASSTSGRS